MKFRSRTSARSTPVASSTRSITRSIRKEAASLPNARYPFHGHLLVMAANISTSQLGILYAVGTQYAETYAIAQPHRVDGTPTSAMIFTRSAVTRPSLL